MEQMEGILVTHYEELHGSGVDLNEVALRAADMYLEMIFRCGFYHADPHPRNFILLTGGVVGVLEFGMVGRMDESLRDHLDTLLLAVSQGDSDLLTEWTLNLGRRLTDLDRAGLQSEVSELATVLASESIGDMDISSAIERMTDIMHRYRLVMPPAVSRLLKTLVMLEGRRATSTRVSPWWRCSNAARPGLLADLRTRGAGCERWNARTGTGSGWQGFCREAWPTSCPAFAVGPGNSSIRITTWTRPWTGW